MLQETTNVNETGKMMKQLFKTGQVLSRNDMKKIVAGAGQCSCSYGGCHVEFGQVSTGWSMAVCCNGDCETYSGSGQYGGTICGGQCPNSDLQVA